MDNGSEAVLRTIKDRLDISDCVQRVSRGIDRLDETVLLSAFHPDAQLDYGFFVGSPAEFAGFFFRVHGTTHLATMHILNNHSCEIDGDGAHAETYYIFSSRNADGSPVSIAAGRYLDRLERRDGRWGIVVRKCIFEWKLEQPGPEGDPMEEIFARVANVSRDRQDVSYDRPLTLSPGRWEARTFA